MNFHPIMNVKMCERTEGVFEAVICRNASLDKEQPVFPTLDEYPSGDLFSPHPLDPQLWQYHGRANNLQVFLTGEKYDPTVLEKQIIQHPDVEEALLIGTRRPRAALHLEMVSAKPIATLEQRNAAIELLWPTIETVNVKSPACAQVSKELVIFTTPQKPMARSGKGTVQRRATVKLYEEELNESFMAVSHTNV